MVRTTLKLQRRVLKRCLVTLLLLFTHQTNATRIWLVRWFAYHLLVARFQLSPTNTLTQSLVQEWLRLRQPTTLTTLVLVTATTWSVSTQWTKMHQWTSVPASMLVWIALMHVRLLLMTCKLKAGCLRLSRLFTQLVTQSVLVCQLSHVCQRNGSLRWSHWLSKLWICKSQTTVLTSTHHVSKILSRVGWTTSTTGLSHVNYGGDTKSQLGTTSKRVRCTLVWKHLKISKTGSKTLTFWIRGSHQLCGHSQRWVGLMKTLKTSSVTSQQTRWLRDTTSSSSGLLVWCSNQRNSRVVVHLRTFWFTVWFVTNKDARCQSHWVTELTQWMSSRSTVLMHCAGSWQLVQRQVWTFVSHTRRWTQLGTSSTRFGTLHVTLSWTWMTKRRLNCLLTCQFWRWPTSGFCHVWTRQLLQ